jgi:acyl-CoA dehydrogenase
MTASPKDPARTALCAELDDFLTDTVEPLEAAHADVLADPRTRYGADGVLTDRVRALRREVCTPVELGGRGVDARTQFTLCEHLYGRCGPDRLLPYDAIGTYTSGPGAGPVGLSREARVGPWQEVLDGEAVLCFALSEPGAAPTDRALQTAANRVPGGWAISGRKQWVSQGAFAEYAVVYATTDGVVPPGSDGISAFLVPLDAPGVVREPTTFLLGRPGGDEITLALEGVVVPDAYVVGELGGGRAVARAGAPSRTMFAAGRALGLSRWAIAQARAFAAGAVVFGRTLAEDGIVLGELAESTTEIAAGRHLALAVADAIDEHASGELDYAMVSAFSARTWGRAYDRAMRILGADALRTDARLYDGWAHAMVVRAAEGTEGPILLDIGRRILAGELPI